jgi:hypothetical protein
VKPTVHILATVRKPELLPAALFVFQTLRTGFPTNPVMVWGNGLDDTATLAVRKEVEKIGATFQLVSFTSHDQWIEALVLMSQEYFWICDTDIAFWSSVEGWEKPSHFSGRFEPEFLEKWMGTQHVARLHTSLMQIDPAPVRSAMRSWACQIPAVWRRTAQFPFIQMHFIPVRGGKPLCYDTCAGLWQAGFGTPFTEEQNLAYDHLHCATYVDAIDGELGKRLATAHHAIYNNKELARGIRSGQEEYYKSQKVIV